MSSMVNELFVEGGQDGPAEGYEEQNFESAIAASRQQAELRSVQELQMELDAIRLKLLRRSQIIDAIRKAYIQDVVVLKNELMRKSAMTEEEYYDQGGPGTNVADAVPSLDMREVLTLFSPEDSFLRVKTCSGCGGYLEIVIRETKRMAKLAKEISTMTERLEESAQEVGRLKAELILARQRAKELEDRNIIDRGVLLEKLEQSKKKYAADVIALKEEMHRADISWRARLAQKDQDLEVVPVLRREVEVLRRKLEEEKAAREDDIQQRDSEIAKLKAERDSEIAKLKAERDSEIAKLKAERDSEIAKLKAEVEYFKSSADAGAKALVDARDEIDDLQRRIEAEKAEHAATKALLDEERSRNERCLHDLEAAQERIDDLGAQLSELRAEVKAAEEAAQGQAQAADDTLAAAKLEIKRLQGLLEASATAIALLEEAKNKGDLSRENEARLIEELKRAKEEIMSLKRKQAMVTQELLGNIKDITAEVDMLRAQLEQMARERDQRVDRSNFEELEKRLSAAMAREEELLSLKKDATTYKMVNMIAKAALKRKLRDKTEALRKLLEGLSKACTETRRTKAKVWNERDLDRARSIPSLGAPSNGREKQTIPAAVPVGNLSNSTAASGERVAAAATVREGTLPPQGVSGGEAVGDDLPGTPRLHLSGGEGIPAKDEKAATLERRRAARAAHALAKKQQKEADAKELDELREACAFPETEGVEFASERLEAVQADVKDQFKAVFVQLKEALEMHKKYVMRSRVEARDTAKTIEMLQAEIDRLRDVLKCTEGELYEKSAVLHQTEEALCHEKNTVADLRRALEAAQKEARDNLYFKEKNASLQKKMDCLEVSSREAKNEAMKAKRELENQARAIEDMMRRLEEFRKREEGFNQRERELKERCEALRRRAEEAEGKLYVPKKKCITTQVSGCGDPDLGLGKRGSTQTSFHCPELTLRRSNYDGVSAARTPGPGAANVSLLPSSEQDSNYRCYTRRFWASGGPMAGIVCPTVDAWVEAAKIDLYSPGAGSAALLEAQGGGRTQPSHSAKKMMGKKNGRNLTQWYSAPLAKTWGPSDEGMGSSADVGTPTTAGEAGYRMDEPTPRGDCWWETTLPRRDTRVTSEEQERPHTTCQHQARSSAAATQGYFDGRPEGSPPPRRLHSRIFLQGAGDTSLCFGGKRCLTNGTPPAGVLRRTKSASMASTLETSPVSTEVQQKALEGKGMGRPKTSSAALLGGGHGWPEDKPPGEHSPNTRIVTVNVPSSVPRREVIDLGILTEVPRARVWDDQHMAAAAAAAVATGRPATWGPSRGEESPSVSLGGREGDQPVRGGVAVDARLAGLRKTLRKDVFDAAERARLPMLH